MSEPVLYAGDVAVDDRGAVSFVNGCDLKDVRRFYVVRNHRRGFVRAWHAHQREGKYVVVVSGAALVGAVEIDDWDHPSKEATVHRFVLSAGKPAVLYVPPGFANGFMTLTEDAAVLFLSTSRLEESLGDDHRFPARYWDVWAVEER